MAAMGYVGLPGHFDVRRLSQFNSSILALLVIGEIVSCSVILFARKTACDVVVVCGDLLHCRLIFHDGMNRFFDEKANKHAWVHSRGYLFVNAPVFAGY